MNVGLSRQQALSLLQQALTEPLGLLLTTPQPHELRQALYRARSTDPSLSPVEIRITTEGIALVNRAGAIHQPSTTEGESLES